MTGTLRRGQTIAPHCNGVLRLSGSERVHNVCNSCKECTRSPYFQYAALRKEAPRQEYSIISDLMKAIYGLDYVAINGGSQYVGVGFFDMTTSPGTCVDVQNLQFDMADTTSPDSISTAAVAAINTYATGQGYNMSDGIFSCFSAASAIPMQVSGVAKTGYYAVVAAPSVAGGSGVARFYVDTNGDGTGTAPSAIFSASLQAVVVNSTASYLPQSITVDTNRKYIDVKMGQLATGLAGIIPILTGAVANAANGTVVNCLVLVQK